MKPTTDGHWAHLACAIWIPGLFVNFVWLHLCFIILLFDHCKHLAETCLADIKKMEPIDGISRINKVFVFVCTCLLLIMPDSMDGCIALSLLTFLNFFSSRIGGSFYVVSVVFHMEHASR